MGSGSPLTPVAAATARRNASVAGEAPPDPRATRRPLPRVSPRPSREQRADGLVHGFELELAQRAFERRHASTTEHRGQPAPLTRGAVAQLAQLPEHVPLVRIQRQRQATGAQLARPGRDARAPGARRGTRRTAPSSSGSPRPSASERRTSRFDPSASLTAYAADSRIRPPSSHSGRGRRPATATGRSRSSTRRRSRRPTRRR